VGIATKSMKKPWGGTTVLYLDCGGGYMNQQVVLVL